MISLILPLFIFNFSFAQSNNYGLFMVVKGDVRILQNKNQEQPAKVGMKVLEGDTVTTGTDSRAKITMADRNNIHISPNSNVKIVTYNTDPTQKNVELQLKDGKVRSEVRNQYDGEKSKYIIKTPTAVAGVRGTDFLVRFDSPSQLTEVVTFKGAVAFSNLLKQGQSIGSTVIVTKQQSATIQQNAPPSPPHKVPDTDFKSMDTNTQAASFAPTGANTAGTSSSENRLQKEAKEPLKDSGDKSAATFDKLPSAPPPPSNGLPNPSHNLLPPPPNTRINDAIRNKTDTTNVIIQPKKPNKP